MRRDAHFWMMMLQRGLLAVMVGSMFLVIPDMTRTLLLLPLAVAIAVLGLALYGVLDSALILISSFMTESRFARSMLQAQGTLGILIGLLLLFVVFDKARLEWFLLLAALQAAFAGFRELVIAGHAGMHAISHWNKTAGVLALFASAAYFVLIFGFALRLNPDHMSWLVFGYLVAFGITPMHNCRTHALCRPKCFSWVRKCCFPLIRYSTEVQERENPR